MPGRPPLVEHRQLHEALLRELSAAGELRRVLHARPSLSGKEDPTTALVLDALPGGEHAVRVAEAGAVVRIGGAGPAVGVRGELDALPVQEATGVSWAATDGVMHACGHDVHLAALVAVSRAVHRAGPPVPMLAVLQPREETFPSGAQDIVESGVLAEQQLAAMVAAHVQPLLAEGEIASGPGVVNASCDAFTIVMNGVAGHGAYPHLSRDPIAALANFVVSSHQLVSRNTNPMEPAVVTIGALQAGAAANVIPGQALARGTVRAMSEEHRQRLLDRLREVGAGVALAHGCTAEVTIDMGEPVLENDPGLAAETARLLPSFGVRVAETLRTCGADDFSFYGEVAPSLMLFVGTGPGGDSGPGLHTATFLPGDLTIRHVAEGLLAAYLAASSMVLAS